MGCASCKSARSHPPHTYCRLPLNPREKFKLTASWNSMDRDTLRQTGKIMFVKLFEENEELLDLFRKFESLKTKESQMESTDFAKHAFLVMTSLNDAIKSVDKAGQLIGRLHQIGKLHRKFPGFKKEDFGQIEIPFLEAIKETLGDQYSDYMDGIYQTFIRFILLALVEGYEDSGDD